MSKICPVILKETCYEFSKMHLWGLLTRFLQNDKDIFLHESDDYYLKTQILSTNHKGIFPCFFLGIFTTLFSNILKDLISF